MKITPREKEVLTKLTEGFTVKEVARFLFVAPSTIETHKQKIYKKMEARTLAQLGAMAVRSGIIAIFALITIVPCLSQSQLEIDGTIKATDLIGSGNRAVVADEDGLLKVVAQDPAVWELKDSTGDVRFRFDANLGLFQMLVEGDTIRETQVIMVPGVAPGIKGPGLAGVDKVVLNDMEGQDFIKKIHDKLSADKTKIELLLADFGDIVKLPDLSKNSEVYIEKGGEYFFENGFENSIDTYDGMLSTSDEIESIQIEKPGTILSLYYESTGLLKRVVFEDILNTEGPDQKVELDLNSSCEVTRKIVNGDTTFIQLTDPTGGTTLSIDPNSLKLEGTAGSIVEIKNDGINVADPTGGTTLSIDPNSLKLEDTAGSVVEVKNDGINVADPTEGTTLSIDPNSLKLEDDSGSSAELTDDILNINVAGGHQHIVNNTGGFVEDATGLNQFYYDPFAISVLSPGGSAAIDLDADNSKVNIFNNLGVNGTLEKLAGSFKIDHPLDPTNKWLYHSFVESPDMMNVYNGNVSTDDAGFATVSLPSYFEALNKDFRYQLTVIGTFAQAIIIKTVKDNKFVIQTDKPNVEVSWQVTGIRDDHFARDHRIVAEVHKKGEDAGRKIYDPQRKEPYSKGLKKHLSQREARLAKK